MVAVREKYANVTQVIYPSVVLFLINQSVSHPARYMVMAIQGDLFQPPSYLNSARNRACAIVHLNPFLYIIFYYSKPSPRTLFGSSTRIYAQADGNSASVCERGIMMFDK